MNCSEGAYEEYARYFDKGTNTGAHKGKIRFYLGQDRLRLEDENVFISLKCSFLFDFLSELLSHDCVVHETGKLTIARNSIQKELLVPLKTLWERNKI